MEKPFPRQTRTAIGGADAEIVKFASTYGESPDAADSPVSYDLHTRLLEAAIGTKFGWLEFRKWERIKAVVKEVSLGLLLLAALIGFAIVCWIGLGDICNAVFSVATK